MFWDLYQQSKINEHSARIEKLQESSSREQRNMQRQLQKATDRLDALMIACQAMWEILRDSNGISEENLMKKIKDVDLRSGALDGKMPKQATKSCPSCDRINNPRHNLCLYCGNYLKESEDPHVFNMP